MKRDGTIRSHIVLGCLGILGPYAMVLHEILLVWNKNSEENLKHCLDPGILRSKYVGGLEISWLSCYFNSCRFSCRLCSWFHWEGFKCAAVGRFMFLVERRVTYYWGVPYPFAFVNPIEMATTSAGNPVKERIIKYNTMTTIQVVIIVTVLEWM